MEFLVSLLLLLIIGIILGSERQSTHNQIGIRTTTLVLLGSYLFTYMSTIMAGDPTRIVGQVVTGIGFLSAGLIFRNGTYQIYNLTTAVLTWVLAALGCMIALHLYAEVLGLTAVVYIILKYYKKLFNYEDR